MIVLNIASQKIWKGMNVICQFAPSLRQERASGFDQRRHTSEVLGLWLFDHFRLDLLWGFEALCGYTVPWAAQWLGVPLDSPW